MVRSRPALLLIALFFLAAGTYLSSPVWLRSLGELLVYEQVPEHADIAVVLAGDPSGGRILRAAQLVKEGYVPKALVSGPGPWYGRHECDLAIDFAASRGCPREWFIPLPNSSRSTLEEARVIIPELRRRNVRRVLIVTSDYHTARARRIYRRLAPDLQMRFVAAPDDSFASGAWWHTREGKKTVFYEWTKTLAEFAGI